MVKSSEVIPVERVMQAIYVQIKKLSQNVIASRKSLGGYNPYVFTEQVT